jgi:dipeptidyl aminopeptidase/acylaminoacyl peptidase
MKSTALLFFLLFGYIHIYSQDQALKMLDQTVYTTWKTIQDQQISADGNTVIYRVVPGLGDADLSIYNVSNKSTLLIPRVTKARIDYDGLFVFGIITPHRDTLRNLERKKTDKKEWPCDTLFIYSAQSGQTEKVPFISEYKNPAKKGGYLAYTLKDAAWPVDTTAGKKKSKKDPVHLIIRELATGKQDTLKYVKEFAWAERAAVLMAVTETKDSLATSGVSFWSGHEWRMVKKQKGEYTKISLPADGNQLAFLGNLDTTKAQVEPWQLFYYDFKTDSAVSLAGQNKSPLPLVSKHADLQWSEDGKYLYYGRAEMPVIKDTTLLPDEIVDVEIWGTNDPVLYTVQNKRLPMEEKRSYGYVYDTQSKQHIGIASPKWESAVYGPERTGRYVLVYTEKPYQKEETWMGDIPKDLARVDLLTGAVLPVKKGLYTNPRISPDNTYAFGHSDADSTWWTCELATGVFSLMNKKGLPKLYNEEADTPGFPNNYGQAGWIDGDQALIFYDRYDLWAWPGKSDKMPVQLTKGREAKIISRYIRTDPDERSLQPNRKWLFEVRNNTDKSEGYAWYDPSTFSIDSIVTVPFDFSRQVQKARSNNTYLFTKENFSVFPDLQLSKDELKTSEQISDVNPQQKEYLWGSIRLYEWMDWDSTMRQGLLVLPPGYDTLRSYPTIVNFYEKSSDELHNHPTPAPHRSTINYAFYASRGYVIFNPDISYTIGMPGESAYQIVMSGVESLVKKRIADPENLALQGHSWGGYQIAYILTRTNMFKCAEAGAAVVNMTSAYGGIRWESGLARLFQYEKEQSRLGKTLWEDPNLYITNSSLFKINKIETPLLLLHNDEDGAVPFEQGIEFYLALRRLDKTAWLLNYRGEPHWPVKWQNRMDFNIRMAQFFDHYLKGAPMPEWMAKGVPAIKRGMKIEE